MLVYGCWSLGYAGALCAGGLLIPPREALRIIAHQLRYLEFYFPIFPQVIGIANTLSQDRIAQETISPGTQGHGECSNRFPNE